MTLAATRAIEKKGRTDEVRVIYDGSNGIYLKPGIRVRDQVRFPTAADGRALLEELAEEGSPHFSLHYDIAKAHRQIAVLLEEWGRQACQITISAANTAQRMLMGRAELDRKAFEITGTRKVQRTQRPPPVDELPDEVSENTVWLNCGGGFGVGSAGYWWGRAGAAVIQFTHYVQGSAYAIYAMLYFDDGWLVGRTEHYEIGLILHLLIRVTIGAPMAWHELGGGLQAELVGYALDVGRFEIGISESRAQWAIGWLGDKVRERRVRFGEL